MDPLGDPLTTCAIQTGWNFTIKPYPRRQFRFMGHPDGRFRKGSVWYGTRNRSDGPEPLLPLGGTVKVNTLVSPLLLCAKDCCIWCSPSQSGGIESSPNWRRCLCIHNVVGWNRRRRWKQEEVRSPRDYIIRITAKWNKQQPTWS